MGERASVSERGVLGASTLTLALTLASWVLMRFGAYTLGKAAGVTLVVGIACGWHGYRTRGEVPARNEPWRWLALAAALCVAFGVLYAAYPTYFLLGGQDPGPYLTFGARIARTGGLDLQVPEIQAWAQRHAPGLYRAFPAVYGDLGAPPSPDNVHPQFVHLFTSYLANFWAAAGVEGAVRANAWVAVLCLASGFLLLRRLHSLAAAFAFVVLLGVNPAFLWASRITLTEVVALWLNLSGLVLLLLAWDRTSMTFGVLGALVLGLGVLNRLDGGLGALALVGFSGAALLETGKRPRIAAAAALVHLVACGFGYFDGRRLAPNYFHEFNRLSGGVLTELIWLTSGLDLLALALALIPRGWKTLFRVNETTLRLGGYALLWSLVLWIAYGSTLRTLSDDPDTATTVLELTWYLSWAVWPLCFVGLAVTLRPAHFQRCLPLLLFSAGTLVIYTSRTDVVHEHIWASRRWVPHTIPLILAGAALGVGSIVTRMRSRTQAIGASAVLGALCLIPVLLFDRPFLFRSMLKGLPAAYERVAVYGREHRDRWPLVTDSVQLGSILTYSYGVPTVVLTEHGAAEAAKGAFVGEIGVGYDPFSLRNASSVQARFSGKYLGRSVDEPPSELFDLRVPLEAGVFGPMTFDLTTPASHPCLRTQGTTRDPDGSLVAKESRGTILWGPWVDLNAGRYRVEWYGRATPGKRKHRGKLDVIFDKGHESVAEMPLDAAPQDPRERMLGGLDFTLDEPTVGVEFRVRVEANSGVALTRLRLQRFGP